ncbi:MAG TPA: LysR family transcriptional regulator [Streptosporangiaceae bacterium]|nr:LysR family transcriptional regulator [Streptosporangiaceae bacterium]
MLPPSTPDLTALDLLDSIAELGSLGQAANRHRMSQPAVSMRMSQLERRLGVGLLQRTPSGTRLTTAGERVVTLSRRVLSEARAMMAGIDALVAEESSHLRVAASLTVAEHLLPGWLVALHRESPDVIFVVEVTNSARVLVRVRDGLADVGFVEGHERRLPGMRTVVLRSDRLVVVVDPAHPWARRASPVSGSDLAGTELIVREAGSGTREILEDGLRPWGGIRSRLELGSTSAILEAARRGEGPAVLSALAVAEDLDAGRLLTIETEGIDLTRALRAVWLKDRPLVPLAERLLNVAYHKSALWVPKESATTPVVPRVLASAAWWTLPSWRPPHGSPCGGSRFSTRTGASAAMHARPRARARTRCRSGSPGPT